MGKGSLIVFAKLLAVFIGARQAAPADGINGSLAQLDLTGRQPALGGRNDADVRRERCFELSR